jgi:putative restriction endonuclease
MPFEPEQLELGGLYSRPELAILWGYESHVGFSKGVFTPRGTGHIIIFVTRQKQRSLTQYNDFLSGDYLHWEGEAKHGNDLRIARAHENGEEIHLFYRDIHHTPFRYHGQVEIVSFIPREARPSSFVFRLVHDLGAQDDLLTHERDYVTLPETERLAVVKARIGQGRFRDDLLEYWGGCAVTGISNPELVIASHIKPWRSSSNEERVFRFNGLLLLPQYDRLFDRGYISFSNDGELLSSPALKTLPSSLLGIDDSKGLRNIDDGHRHFLAHHRERVFLHSTGDS